MTLNPPLLSLALAFLTTAILFTVALPVAYWLTITRSFLRPYVESLAMLPLILPPTVLGFYLLTAFSPTSLLGRLYVSATGQSLSFSFTGILIASVIYNLPFSLRPFTAAFSSVDRRYPEAAWCLGISSLKTFFMVTLPLAGRGILAGVLLTFAHTTGEFGVVLMVGGNIPGVTRTVSMAIYDDVQALQYEAAARTSFLLLVLSFVTLVAVFRLEKRKAGV